MEKIRLIARVIAKPGRKSELRHWKIGESHKVRIVGLGGLGHMGLKLASAFGAEVTLFSTSPDAEHEITSDVELVPIQQINEAYLRLERNDVKYRFVIDMASLKDAAAA